jgi:hypothetical protein
MKFTQLAAHIFLAEIWMELICFVPNGWSILQQGIPCTEGPT